MVVLFVAWCGFQHDHVYSLNGVFGMLCPVKIGLRMCRLYVACMHEWLCCVVRVCVWCCCFVYVCLCCVCFICLCHVVVICVCVCCCVILFVCRSVV